MGQSLQYLLPRGLLFLPASPKCAGELIDEVMLPNGVIIHQELKMQGKGGGLVRDQRGFAVVPVVGGRRRDSGK